MSTFRGYCAYDILPEQKGIFIHNPRTGGTTVSRHVGRIAPRMILGHATAEFVKTSVGKDVWDKMFTFAFIRNPWEKHVSWYLYCNKKFGIPISFDEVVKRNYMSVVHSGSIDWITRGFWSQSIFVTSEAKKEVLVDFIGVYENFNEDFGYICKELGLKNNFGFLNKNKDYDYRTFYSDVSAEIIKNKCAWEIERYGYKFDEYSRIASGA